MPAPAVAPRLRHASLVDLQADHVLIRRYLAAIERSLALPPAAPGVDELAEVLGAFVDDFIDAVHHVKEDAIVYDELQRRHAELGRWLEDVHEEHEEGWCHAEGMRMARADRRAGWWTAWCWNARGLVRTILGHIEREEREIFPRLDSLMNAETDARIGARVASHVRDPRALRRTWAHRLDELVAACRLDRPVEGRHQEHVVS